MDLAARRCVPCEGGQPLGSEEVQKLLRQLDHWSLDAEGKSISRTFPFENFYQTIAFANAVAWIANSENHHPDLEVSYKTCHVRYTTHGLHGLSENDFISAARVNRLLDA